MGDSVVLRWMCVGAGAGDKQSQALTEIRSSIEQARRTVAQVGPCFEQRCCLGAVLYQCDVTVCGSVLLWCFRQNCNSTCLYGMKGTTSLWDIWVTTRILLQLITRGKMFLSRKVIFHVIAMHSTPRYRCGSNALVNVVFSSERFSVCGLETARAYPPIVLHEGATSPTLALLMMYIALRVRPCNHPHLRRQSKSWCGQAVDTPTDN